MTLRDCGPNEASSISGRAFMVCSQLLSLVHTDDPPRAEPWRNDGRVIKVQAQLKDAGVYRPTFWWSGGSLARSVLGSSSRASGCSLAHERSGGRGREPTEGPTRHCLFASFAVLLGSVEASTATAKVMGRTMVSPSGLHLTDTRIGTG